MKKSDILDSIEFVDAILIKEAEFKTAKKKSHIWMKRGTISACLCFITFVSSWAVPKIINEADPKFDSKPHESILSTKTTAKITHGGELPNVSVSYDLVPYTEKELFSEKSLFCFRGKICGYENYTIDYNGSIEVRCVAIVSIEKVYSGTFPKNVIRMRLPYGISLSPNSKNVWVEDSETLTHLGEATDCIFTAFLYDDTDIEMLNEATLVLKDIADCGLGDGVRWAFLETENGLIFDRSSYKGVQSAKTLDDIEKYVIKMLK